MSDDRRRMTSQRVPSAVHLLASALAATLAVALPAVVVAQRRVSTTPVVFDGATVVDVEQGRLVPAQRVVIAGTRIQAVGPADRVPVPAGSQVVDARGKYLIPGLWDMHVHIWTYPDVMYPLFLAYGVTGIRDMHPGPSSLAALQQQRREILAGTRVGPRSVLTGSYLTGPPAANEEVDPTDVKIMLATPERARQVVDSLQAAGAEFIKERGGLPREVYFAALAEARRLGIPFVGHLNRDVPPAEASDSGQLTLEHFSGCQKDDTAEQCAALAARYRRNGTWATPTLVTLRYFFGGVDADRRRFWPDSVREPYFGMRNEDGRRGDDAEQTRRVAQAIRAGVPMLAGTDASSKIPEATPGLSLQEEVGWLVEAGMSPLDALRTATLNPAKMLHATDSLGTVAAGKLADVVVLDADPLAAITNLKQIRAVVANGRYFDRAALDSLVADVVARAKRAP